MSDKTEGTLLRAVALTKHFPARSRGMLGGRSSVVAVDGVSFEIDRGETLCLVGETGCGKSTVSRMIARLIEPTSGSVILNGLDITRMSKAKMRPHRRHMQFVFQDPYASLSPRMSAGEIVGEPLENFTRLSGQARKAKVIDLLRQVGLREDAFSRLPFEFSGGQRQRLNIARAIALDPDLVIADEPVSALDVSVQAQVLNLLMDLQEDRGLAYLFVSHDLAVVQHIGHRIAVMFGGRIVEIASKTALFDDPQHPYTRTLIAAAPVPAVRRMRPEVALEADAPASAEAGCGCAFYSRCRDRIEQCRTDDPKLRPSSDGRMVACHRADASTTSGFRLQG